jgi:hypothetical protein
MRHRIDPTTCSTYAELAVRGENGAEGAKSPAGFRRGGLVMSTAKPASGRLLAAATVDPQALRAARRDFLRGGIGVAAGLVVPTTVLGV